MKIYEVQAFAETPEQGNAAGVVYLTTLDELEPEQKQEIARDLGVSETAFISKRADGSFEIRYYTPACEIALCGHATIAAFAVLRSLNEVEIGSYVLHTYEQQLYVNVSTDHIWLKIDEPQIIRTLNEREIHQICTAYGLQWQDVATQLMPVIVDVGIADVQFPVKRVEILDRVVQQEEKVKEISEQLQVVGVHMYCLAEPEEEVTVHCRNFAPLYGIPEECATGTSNGGLTYYLYKEHYIQAEAESCFLQGEAMGRPSRVYSRVRDDNGRSEIWIGGQAVVTKIHILNID